jgi:hypothetical protein
MALPTGLTGKETVLSAAIKAKVQEKNPEFAENIQDSWDWLFDAIAEAVSSHVRDNLLVVAVDSTFGVITHNSNT